MIPDRHCGCLNTQKVVDRRWYGLRLDHKVFHFQFVLSVSGWSLSYKQPLCSVRTLSQLRKHPHARAVSLSALLQLSRSSTAAHTCPLHPSLDLSISKVDNLLSSPSACSPLLQIRKPFMMVKEHISQSRPWWTHQQA